MVTVETGLDMMEPTGIGGQVVQLQKKCGHCRVVKPMADFHRSRNRSDGRQGWCRTCGLASKASRRVRKRPLAPPGLKRCATCGETKPVSDFRQRVDGQRYDGSHGGLGLYAYCRPCERAYNNERAREFSRTDQGRVARREKVRRDCRDGKYQARLFVAMSLKYGYLTKGPCEVCGSARVHAHHTDYSDPLNVRWLCPTHHGQLHTGTFTITAHKETVG